MRVADCILTRTGTMVLLRDFWYEFLQTPLSNFPLYMDFPCHPNQNEERPLPTPHRCKMQKIYGNLYLNRLLGNADFLQIKALAFPI